MQLPVLQSHPHCDKCDVCKLGAVHRGMATVWHPESRAPGPDVPALLFVGQHPSLVEDEKGEPFMGPSGQLFRRVYLKAGGFLDKASVYMTNIVRCAPVQAPPGWDLPRKAMTACKPYLFDDMEAIEAVHTNAPLYVIVLGSKASQAVLGRKLEPALKIQGRTLEHHHAAD